ncbi:response regulator [Paenibacillus solisilvae]|uniref:Response regulator n=1 Tax=Paenibacillus solisilvae TaxID=2486751 RepID=A0ABW0W2H4_9BACL
MHRLMIVDDEPDIVDGLFMVLSQATHLELDLYKAYSAYEALDWLNRTQIDIVMSDIQMPGMSGMQLAEKIRQRWPRCRIIFVTGHNDFEYAYSAIRHEASGYLLKTEGFEEITAQVEKTLDKIRQDCRIADLLSASREGMREVLPLMQREFWTDVLQGEPLTAEERRAKFDELAIGMNPDRPLQLVVGRIDQLPKSQSALQKIRMLYTLHYLAEQCISQELIRMYSVCERALIVWFVQSPSGECPPEGFEQNALYIKGSLEAYQKLCLESLGLPVSFMVDTGPVGWEDVPCRYDEIRTTLYTSAGSGMDIYLMPAERKSAQTQADRTDAVRQRHKSRAALETSLESGHREEFHKLLLRMTEGLQQEYIGASPSGLELVSAINLMFLSYINRLHLRDKIGLPIDLGKLLKAEPHIKWSQACGYYAKLADAIFDLRLHEEQNRTVFAINQTRQYILEHLGEDLSLVTLAERVYFNPSYLSRVFKQITGTNLLAFVNESRLARAKELLRDPNMKIHEIAGAIGCVSPPYFTQFFKKAFHISPQEYRESLLKQVK